MGPGVQRADLGRRKLWVCEQLATSGLPSSADQDLTEGTREDTRQRAPLELEHGFWGYTGNILKTYSSC